MLLLTFLLACVPHSYTVHMAASGPDAHFVLVQGGAMGGEAVYDCISRPDGEKWKPTCVKAKLLSGPPAE